MQVCQINLVVSEADADSVRLSLGEPFIDIDKELTQYYITDNHSLQRSLKAIGVRSI